MRHKHIHSLLFSLISIGILFFLLGLSACSTGFKTIRYNLPSISDYEIFPSRIIENEGPIYPLVQGYAQAFPPLENWAQGNRYDAGDSPRDFFRKTGTVALLVLKGDTIQHEYYDPEYSALSTFTTFSLAKIFISTLVGIALNEGDIKSLDQPVSDYLPRFSEGELADISIRHLLQMTSGIRSGEKFTNPMNRLLKMYYGNDLEKATRKIKLKQKPGEQWEYLNINTQLLAFILQKATGKSISDYLSEKIWKPIGMEAPATWSLDHEDGMEKAFCCLNARARDFARFGLIFLNEGKCGESQLISADWICEATSIDTTQGSNFRFQYSWYTSNEQQDYFGQGMIGQFLYVCPEKNIVIVRLGKKIEFSPWYDMFRTLSGVGYKPQKIELEKTALKKFEGEYLFGPSNLDDSTLIGKLVKIKAQKSYLIVQPEFRSKFRMYPQSDLQFFSEKEGRHFFFYENTSQEIIGMLWSRRGNSWELQKKESGNLMTLPE